MLIAIFLDTLVLLYLVAAPHLHSLTTTFLPCTRYVATYSVDPHPSPSPLTQPLTHIRHPHPSPTPLIQNLSFKFLTPAHPSHHHALTLLPQQNVNAPEEDPELKVELYTRSSEQNELLGLDHMNVD